MKEQWRDIIGFKGLYQVSRLGQFRSLDRIVKHGWGGPKRLKGQIIKSRPDKLTGRLSVTLWKNGKKSVILVHRLVLQAFIGPCPAGMECCHNDGNPTNNKLENLRWDTHSNNKLDMRIHGTHKGRQVRRSDGVEFISMAVAAEETNCFAKNIQATCKGNRKLAGGYGWQYI